MSLLLSSLKENKGEKAKKKIRNFSESGGC